MSIEDSDKLVCSGRFEYGLITRYVRVGKSLVLVCISGPIEAWAGINIAVLSTDLLTLSASS